MFRDGQEPLGAVFLQQRPRCGLDRDDRGFGSLDGRERRVFRTGVEEQVAGDKHRTGRQHVREIGRGEGGVRAPVGHHRPFARLAHDKHRARASGRVDDEFRLDRPFDQRFS